MKATFTLAVVGVFCATAHAQDIQTEKTISLKVAAELATTAVADCSSKGYNTVAAVVDRSGYLKALHRADNARPHAIDIAIRKAHTSSMVGYETRILAENIQKGTTPASITATPGFTSLLGGFPIKAGNEVIGGIGVSGAPGGHLDAACVDTALKAAQSKLN